MLWLVIPVVALIVLLWALCELRDHRRGQREIAQAVQQAVAQEDGNGTDTEEDEDENVDEDVDDMDANDELSPPLGGTAVWIVQELEKRKETGR